ncbi:hypothetical protein MUN89_15915 [Halobacillus salinarum]|uniref:Uncharacterized protein n=1 Tax=Halobacillus salinarum TaxID=2932257 RepID=A0ABY4EG04_9BACI|nr:hypothetical protein [Halobacillus salinarum]UOQ43395.1 hypothetical protein MUN89_15915 [Halobacillus salinarum]
MGKLLTIWKDIKGNVGIIELVDGIFDRSFYPVVFSSKDMSGYEIIGNRWYTTYTGARQFFRAKTSTYIVKGRMIKVNLGAFIERESYKEKCWITMSN